MNFHEFCGRQSVGKSDASHKVGAYQLYNGVITHIDGLVNG